MLLNTDDAPTVKWSQVPWKIFPQHFADFESMTFPHRCQIPGFCGHHLSQYLRVGRSLKKSTDFFLSKKSSFKNSVKPWCENTNFKQNIKKSYLNKKIIFFIFLNHDFFQPCSVFCTFHQQIIFFNISLAETTTRLTNESADKLRFATGPDKQEIDRKSRGHDRQRNEALRRFVEQRKQDEEQHDKKEENWQQQIHLQP